MASRNNWTRDQHLAAFNLYSRLPFGKMHKTNPQIIELAKLLGRTPSAVAFKLSNFAAGDPVLQKRGISGMAHGAKGEKEIWQEFHDDPETLAFASEKASAALRGDTVDSALTDEENEVLGVDREAFVKVRVNQQFFRKRVLSAYEHRCCVTGLGMPNLLVASHIVPWAKDQKNRLNTRNGLCLNALHDRAFELGLMWVADDFSIHFSERLMDEGALLDARWLIEFEGAKLRLSEKFSPDPELLSQHREIALSKS